MFFSLVSSAAIVLFAMQLLLCFKCRTGLLRLGPLALLCFFDVVLWTSFWIRPSYSAYIIGLIGLCWTVALLLAWGIYGIIKAIKKK